MAAPPVPAAHRLQAERPGALSDEAAAAVERDGGSVFQRLAYARALDAVRGDARIVRVLDGDRGLGQVLVREEVAFGFVKWNGIADPALAAGADPVAFFEALFSGARAARVASIAWREPTLTRFSPELLAAARAACERTGARASLGELETRVLDLGRGADALWEGFDRKHRNAARNAERAGVRIERPAPAPFLDAFMPLADATWARSGRAGPSRDALAGLLASPWAWAYLAVDAAGAPLAAAIVAVDGARAVYLHGASAPTVRGASQLLQWRVVQDLVAARVHAYDLGGGPVPGSLGDDAREQGIRAFKEGFGGAVQRWPTLQVAPDPALYDEARAAVVRAAQAKQG